MRFFTRNWQTFLGSVITVSPTFKISPTLLKVSMIVRNLSESTLPGFWFSCISVSGGTCVVVVGGAGIVVGGGTGGVVVDGGTGVVGGSGGFSKPLL